MKITCHSCGAKYTVSDDKIQGKTVKMKCRKCSATIVVGNAQAEGAAGGDAGSPPAGSFLVNVADGDQRTMTAAEIADGYRAGTITDDTYVWADGMSDWQTVLENADIAPLIGGGGGSPAPAYTAPSPEPAAAEPARAARKEPKASRDLFGEAPAATGSSGGLFGSSASMGASASSGGGLSTDTTGKRDENSVLFSLSALTSVEASAPAGKTTAKKDDSGLIDLKALALSAPATSSTPMATDNLGMSDAGAVFPLGMPILAPPPQAAPAVGMDVSAPPQKSKVGIIVGGAVAIVAMVLVFFLVKGNPPPPPAPAPAQTAAAPPPTVAEPTPPPPTEPSADAAASASASAAPVAKGGGKWPPKGKGTAPTSGGGTPPPGGGDAPKPPPPKSKCGCAASDLMCNMKCSAGK